MFMLFAVGSKSVGVVAPDCAGVSKLLVTAVAAAAVISFNLAGSRNESSEGVVGLLVDCCTKFDS